MKTEERWKVHSVESTPRLEDQEGVIVAPIGNYYGTPFVTEKQGRCYFGLTNHDGTSLVEVSRRFFDAFAAEFTGVREAQQAEVDAAIVQARKE